MTSFIDTPLRNEQWTSKKKDTLENDDVLDDTKKQAENILSMKEGTAFNATKPGLALGRLNKVITEVGSVVFGRATELEQIRYALLLGEHVFLKGSPGTAKSYLALQVFQRIHNGSLFKRQLSKFMSEDYLLGPLNVKTLRDKGELEHNTAGTLVDAEYAYLDEFFDGSDVLLRTMLEILNERTFSRAKQSVKCPLHTAILTSNYARKETATDAVLDRILFKSEVKPLNTADRQALLALASTRPEEEGTKTGIPHQDILSLHSLVKGDHIKIPQELLKPYDTLLSEYGQQTSTTVSDRKAVKMLRLLRASALVHGRKQVDFCDFRSLRFALCMGNDANQEGIFAAVCTKIAGNSLAQDEVTSLYERLHNFLATEDIRGELNHYLEDPDTTTFKKNIKSAFLGVMKLKTIARKLQYVYTSTGTAPASGSITSLLSVYAFLLGKLRAFAETDGVVLPDAQFRDIPFFASGRLPHTQLLGALKEIKLYGEPGDVCD